MKTFKLQILIISVISIALAVLFIKYSEFNGVSLIPNIAIYELFALVFVLGFDTILLRRKIYQIKAKNNERISKLTESHDKLLFEITMQKNNLNDHKKDLRELNNQYSLLKKTCDLKEELCSRLYQKSIDLDTEVKHLKMSSGAYRSNFLQERNRRFRLQYKLKAKEKEVAEMKIHCSVLESKVN